MAVWSKELNRVRPDQTSHKQRKKPPISRPSAAWCLKPRISRTSKDAGIVSGAFRCVSCLSDVTLNVPTRVLWDVS